MGQPHEFNSSDEAFEEIQSRRDDIDFVRIPIPDGNYQVGGTVVSGGMMELRFCDGRGMLISLDIAERVLNDGLLNRLRIPIRLELQKSE